MTFYSHYIGWDCSKNHLDYCLFDDQGQNLAQGRIENEVDQIVGLLQQLFTAHDLNGHQCLQCVENTGLYTNPLRAAAQVIEMALWCQDPLQIKLSLGRQKDKTDAGDARLIAAYARRFADQAQLYRPANEVVEQLTQAVKQRASIVAMRKALRTARQEKKAFSQPGYLRGVDQIVEEQITAMTVSIQRLDELIEEIINNDPTLTKKYEVARSVPGLGPRNTPVILAITGIFEKLPNARICASYAGLSPHEHQSGSSIKRKSRTSKACNKELKTALHQAAIATLRTKGVFRQFYDRLRDNGKTHLVALNALRNKIARVLYACIINDTMYQKKLHGSLQKL